jgi:predicted patatin/cPLA2 family phospholipase
MKALVISGGGSKGAFAGGVAEYLIKEQKKDYDIYIGTSTGSLLISQLALNEIDKLKGIYTNVNQHSIFSNNPFVIKKVHGEKVVTINHIHVLWNLIRGRKTFGESGRLRKLIRKNFSKLDFQKLKESSKEVVVTVSNLTSSHIEYKALSDYSYDEFCDWTWASCNYVPFMSLFEKDNCQYADGGFGDLVPIREAIKRGAKEVDVIVLDTEVVHFNRMPIKNPFSLISAVFDFTMEHVEKHNLTIGKLAAKNKDVKLNLYYTPTVLTTNSLIFDKEKMTLWWEEGYLYAKKTFKDQMSPLKFDK